MDYRVNADIYAVISRQIDYWDLLPSHGGIANVYHNRQADCTDILSPYCDCFQMGYYRPLQAGHVSDVSPFAESMAKYLSICYSWSVYYLRWWIVNQSLR